MAWKRIPDKRFENGGCEIQRDHFVSLQPGPPSSLGPLSPVKVVSSVAKCSDRGSTQTATAFCIRICILRSLGHQRVFLSLSFLSLTNAFLHQSPYLACQARTENAGGGGVKDLGDKV